MRALRYWSARVRRSSPIRLVVAGYLSYVLMGWLALLLPPCRTNAEAGWLDHLFTAVSALSTTGLTTVSTADTYTRFGELIVLLLIQAGGLGYMTLGSFIVLSAAGDLSTLRERIASTALNPPAGFQIQTFLRVIVVFTLLIEAAGAAALYPRFVAHGSPAPLWEAVFHSVSAFCTAGFGLYNNSLESFRDDVRLNVVIGLLSYLGAIGFIVLHDLWQSITMRKPRITLTSKVILVSTFWILVVGTILFALDETSVRTLPGPQRWMAALFQVMTASTTVGFNTIPIGALSASSLFLLTVIMMIGASPSGTGGGIKTTTLTALWAEMMAVIRRQGATTFLGREIPPARLRTASASMLFYCLTLATGIYVFALVDPSPLPDQMFECASALGTVGLSRGITGGLGPAAQWVLIVLMFVGRAGPLVLGMALANRRAQADPRPAKSEDIAI